MFCLHAVCLCPQEEYRAESITWHNIDYIDNTGCIHLISRKPTGLLPLLDEESKYVTAPSCREILNIMKYEDVMVYVFKTIWVDRVGSTTHPFCTERAR